MKHWVTSLDSSNTSDINVVHRDVEKVLGLRWNPQTDTFHFQIKLNFSRKVKNVHTGPDLTIENAECSMPIKLTRRSALSQMSKTFDPNGFVVPFTLEAKILMRKICSLQKGSDEKFGWDD